jgi:hypothetical protein
MNHAKTSFNREIFAGATVSVESFGNYTKRDIPGISPLGVFLCSGIDGLTGYCG